MIAEDAALSIADNGAKIAVGGYRLQHTHMEPLFAFASMNWDELNGA
jgi:hypothetical protein